MTTLRLLAILLALSAFTLAKDKVELKNAKGESVGHAILYNGYHGLKIQYDLKNLQRVPLSEQADPTWRPEVQAAIARCLELLRGQSTGTVAGAAEAQQTD